MAQKIVYFFQLHHYLYLFATDATLADGLLQEVVMGAPATFDGPEVLRGALAQWIRPQYAGSYRHS
jgi:hypothetical protein